MTAPIASSQAAVYELAYRDGIRALGEQSAAMEATRTRAGLLLSAAAVATSLLGGPALDESPSMLSWAAIGSFVLLGIGVILILWPSRYQEQWAQPGLLLSTYAEPDALELPLVHRDLALHMDASYQINRARLGRLITMFRGCSLLLLGETVFWVVDLIVNG